MTPVTRDPFVLLGLEPGSTRGQIESAYRALARTHHPDRNPDDPSSAARFADIAWAARTLLHDPATPETEGPSSPSAPLSVVVAIPLAAAAAADTPVDAVLVDTGACSHCGGIGASPGSRAPRCATCRGAGSHILGRMATQCGDCDGRGVRISEPCPECLGTGVAERQRAVVLDVTAGLATPRASIGGVAIEVRVEVIPSAVLTEIGDDDLGVEVPVTYAEACLGAEIRVPAPHGTLLVPLPAGADSQSVLRIRGHGKRTPSGRGDLFVRPRVIVPVSLTPALRRLVTEMGAHERPTSRRDLINRHNTERRRPLIAHNALAKADDEATTPRSV